VGAPLLVRLFLFGDSGVGKSALFRAYRGEAYEPSTIASLGVDFTIRATTGDLRVQLWDTPGLFRARDVALDCARRVGVDGIVLVYDVTDRETFSSLRSAWQAFLKHEPLRGKRVLLVGSKCASAARAVSRQQGEDLAALLGFAFAELDATRGHGDIVAAFDRLAIASRDAALAARDAKMVAREAEAREASTPPPRCAVV
jgi:small GTP-binding protein